MARKRFHPMVILIFGLLAVPEVLAAAPGRPKAVVNAAECRALLAEPAVPGAAYVPGVDVNGQPVVPADIGGMSPLGDIAIDLRTLLDQVSGGTVPPLLSASEIREGRIRIGLDDGEVSLNGHRLGPQATAVVRAACRKASRR